MQCNHCSYCPLLQCLWRAKNQTVFWCVVVADIIILANEQQKHEQTWLLRRGMRLSLCRCLQIRLRVVINNEMKRHTERQTNKHKHRSKHRKTDIRRQTTTQSVSFTDTFNYQQSNSDFCFRRTWLYSSSVWDGLFWELTCTYLD